MYNEAQNSSVYFKEDQLKKKEELLSALYFIDCNLSKIISELMQSIIEQCAKIKADGNNYKQYTWEVTVKRK